MEPKSDMSSELPHPDLEAKVRIRRCLESPFPHVRIHGLRQCGPGEESWVRLRVLQLFEDPDEEVQREAIRAAAEMGHPGAIDRFVTILEGSNESLRAEAASALQRLGSLLDPEPELDPKAPLASEVVESGPPGSSPEEPSTPSTPDLAAILSKESGPVSEAEDDPASSPELAPSLSELDDEEEAEVQEWVETSRKILLESLKEDLALDASDPEAEEDPGEARGPQPPLGSRRSTPISLPRGPRSRSSLPTAEVLCLVGFLGFVVGRYIPMLRQAPVEPPPTQVQVSARELTRPEARNLLFPGNDLVSRIGRAASEVVDGHMESMPKLHAALVELHFPQLRSPTTQLSPRSQEPERSLSISPPRTRVPVPTQPEAASSLPLPEAGALQGSKKSERGGGASRSDSSKLPLDSSQSNQVRELRIPLGGGHATVLVPPGADLKATEDSIYLESARNYYQLGDVGKASELLGLMLGREPLPEELEALSEGGQASNLSLRP